MNRLTLAALAASLFAGAAVAQTPDENKCRSAESVYSAYSYLYGTASGRATDTIIFRRANGTVLSSRSVGSWCGAYGSDARVYDVVFHSSGEISIRFRMFCFTQIAGGTYEVVRNGVVIDRDRIW